MSPTNRATPRSTLPLVRCAIYTRKSTEEGLEQEFNSLDAQRESAEAYVRSQAGEGWTCLPDRYDDGGYTGGNMERPALRRLLADVEGRVRKVREQIHSVRDRMLKEEDGATALSLFDPLWETLAPAEQARVVGLLVECVD